MEVYIDDMLVKSSRASDHVPQLQECFDILNKFRMKLNPTKFTFGVAFGEFLSYLVTVRGIEANPKADRSARRYPTPTVDPRRTTPHRKNSRIKPFYIQINR